MTDALEKLQLYVGDEVGQELYNEVRAEDATLRTRIAELEAALKYYADYEENTNHSGDYMNTTDGYYTEDWGNIARKALEQ